MLTEKEERLEQMRKWYEHHEAYKKSIDHKFIIVPKKDSDLDIDKEPRCDERYYYLC